MIHCSMIFCQRINISNYICWHTELLKNPPFNANTTAHWKQCFIKRRYTAIIYIIWVHTLIPCNSPIMTDCLYFTLPSRCPIFHFILVPQPRHLRIRPGEMVLAVVRNGNIGFYRQAFVQHIYRAVRLIQPQTCPAHLPGLLPAQAHSRTGTAEVQAQTALICTASWQLLLSAACVSFRFHHSRSLFSCKGMQILKSIFRIFYPDAQSRPRFAVFPFRPLMGRASGKNLYKNVLVAVRAVCYDGF